MNFNFLKDNKGVTLVTMVMVIIVITIIASISIIGGTEIIKNARESKAKENLTAVKAFVNSIYVKQNTSGVFTPANSNYYGTPAFGIVSGDAEILNGWYLIDEDDLKEMGIEYVEENYLVNYKSNLVIALSEWKGEKSSGNVETPEEPDRTLTGVDGSIVKRLTEEEINQVGNDNLKSSTTIDMVVKADDDTGVVPIPNGFEYVEGTEQKGLVIKDSKGNEFVWTPVSDVKAMYSEGNAVSVDFVSSPKVTTMTTKWGKSVLGLEMQAPNKYSARREPAILSDGVLDGGQSNLTQAGFNNLQEFADDITSNFNNMIESVGKYGGFYVGRYELGYDNEVVCKKGVPAITAYSSSGTNYYGSDETATWYGLYKTCKAFSSSSVSSNMIWGCQWDAMTQFIGNHTATAPGTRYLTGADEYNDKAKNVYDTSTGSVYEWTAATLDDTARATNGGYYLDARSLTSLGNPYPYRGNAYTGTRVQLFIK